MQRSSGTRVTYELGDVMLPKATSYYLCGMDRSFDASVFATSSRLTPPLIAHTPTHAHRAIGVVVLLPIPSLTHALVLLALHPTSH